MKKRFYCLPALLLVAGGAQAQSAGDAVCPQLPADSNLVWQHKSTASSDFCSALREDGSEAFGLFIANDSPFKPSRANRAEQASIDGRAVQWYRSELSQRPDTQARETVIELPGGRVAHVWVQAGSAEQLTQAMAQTRDLRFRNAQLSSK